MTETPERPEPCPFCGSTEIIQRQVYDEDDWIVSCRSKLSECPMEIVVKDCYSEEQALEAWNRRASVISSASPLSEEEIRLLKIVRDGMREYDFGDEWHALGRLIDRLSASAPSPEDAPAEPTLVVGFNPETRNPTVEARSVETSDFCAACVRGYCEDRYSIRECRGHWHVTMCGADLAIPGDPFASAEIAQRAADAENRGRDPGGEA